MGLTFCLETLEIRTFIVLLYCTNPSSFWGGAQLQIPFTQLILISFFIYFAVECIWLIILTQVNIPFHLSPRKQTYIDQTKKDDCLFFPWWLSPVHMPVCGIFHSSEKAKSHMTLKLHFLDVSVFKMKVPKKNILWTEIKQVTFQANEMFVVKFWSALQALIPFRR